MLNVGLTGGIACGKSTVAEMFVCLGGHLIDFDLLAHEVQEPGKPAWQDVVNCFGAEILLPDRRIDRNKLGSVVFNDQALLKRLNTIVHPRVFEEWCGRLEKIQTQTPHAIVFSDVPLLFEGGMQHLFELTIVVMIEPTQQIERLMTRNAVCRDDAERRLNSQMPIGEKAGLADIVIDNTCDIFATEKKVAGIWQDLLARESNKRN
jgi:dephospho-CoA kinase